jgi:hypothetical protein
MPAFAEGVGATGAGGADSPEEKCEEEAWMHGVKWAQAAAA